MGYNYVNFRYFSREGKINLKKWYRALHSTVGPKA